MRNPIQQAFDPIKAEPELIENTRRRLSDHALSARRSPPDRRLSRMRAWAAVLAVILLTGVIAAAGLMVMTKPVAAISLDINPSITLEVNALNRVISVISHNEAGRQLIDNEVLNRPVQSAMAHLITVAAKAGYLAEDGSTIINVTTAARNVKRQEELGTAVGQSVEAALTETGKSAVVFEDAIGFDRVQKARELDITPGRLNLIEKLIELDETVTIEDMTGLDNQAIMRQVVAKSKAIREQQKNYADKMERALEKSNENAQKNNQGKANNASGKK